MSTSFNKILEGYQAFRDKYVHGDTSIMRYLARHGQNPDIMVVACCDSRVDPAVILQCDPGDLFVVRNVANIVPPYEKDALHHGTSAALEFGVCFLNVEHLILLGHSQCGGIEALLANDSFRQNDFISNWVSLIKTDPASTQAGTHSVDEHAKQSLHQSHKNCMDFPWIKERVDQKKLTIHQWFFNIKTGQIFAYCESEKTYKPLESLSE